MKIETSIIITCYNSEKYISQCIDSCINQKNYKNYEIIVVDDGSKDNSKRIIKNYKKKIKFINLKKNIGIEKSVNLAIKKSLGKFIIRLDSDDIFLEDILYENIRKLKNKNIDFVYSNYYLINEKNTYKKKIFLPTFNRKEIISRGDFLASGTLYKKNILKKYGYLSTEYKNCGLENYEIILKIISSGYRGYRNKKFLFKFRKHKKNMSLTRKKSILRYGRILFKKIGLKDKYLTGKYHPSNV